MNSTALLLSKLERFETDAATHKVLIELLCSTVEDTRPVFIEVLLSNGPLERKRTFQRLT